MLETHGVVHVVVGGVAAILEGAPVATFDLDVVYRVDDDNLARLERALGEVGATYRDPAGRRIEPTAERLRTHRTNLLRTAHGPLDLMQRIGAGWDHADVVSRSKRIEVEGMQLHVLCLEAVIESKQAADRDKDRAMLPVLLRTLELRRR
jgi:hypothetical protein